MLRGLFCAASKACTACSVQLSHRSISRDVVSKQIAVGGAVSSPDGGADLGSQGTGFLSVRTLEIGMAMLVFLFLKGRGRGLSFVLYQPCTILLFFAYRVHIIQIRRLVVFIAPTTISIIGSSPVPSLYRTLLDHPKFQALTALRVVRQGITETRGSSPSLRPPLPITSRLGSK